MRLLCRLFVTTKTPKKCWMILSQDFNEDNYNQVSQQCCDFGGGKLITRELYKNRIWLPMYGQAKDNDWITAAVGKWL